MHCGIIMIGNMRSEAHAGATVFHASVVSLLSIMYPGDFLVFMGLVVLDEGLRFDRTAIGFGLLVCLPLAWVVSWILSRCFPDIVSTDGIQGHSFWRLRRSVRWQDIKEVRDFRLFHLRFLRLCSGQDQKVTWIALFQARAQDFRRKIQRLAPSDSPILRFVV
jgi:hypothetical protein